MRIPFLPRAAFMAGVAASLTLLALPAQAEQWPGEGDLYYGFTLIDPDTRTVVRDAHVLVAEGKIVSIGGGIPDTGDGIARHDMSGLFMLPGFVDAHAHITAGVHKVEVIDGAPTITIESDPAVTHFAAPVALAFGVTSVRNPAGVTATNAQYDADVAAGRLLGPEAVHAGAVIQPPPFGGNAFAYPTTEEAWNAEAAEQAAAGMRYFKLYESLTADEVAIGVRVAKAHGLIPIGHFSTLPWLTAIRLGVEELEHTLMVSDTLLEPDARAAFLAEKDMTSRFIYRWFELADYDGPLIRELVRELAERGTRVTLTLWVNELTFNADQIDAIWPAAWQAHEYPATLVALKQFMAMSVMGWTADDFARARAVMPRVLAFAKLLHDAGVPLMLGTDGRGGTPILAHEMALHVAAGIPVWDVLAMATSRGADLAGFGERTGHLRPGFEADLVFLSSNPLDDVMNAATVDAVVSDGAFHRARDILAEVMP